MLTTKSVFSANQAAFTEGFLGGAYIPTGATLSAPNPDLFLINAASYGAIIKTQPNGNAELLLENPSAKLIAQHSTGSVAFPCQPTSQVEISKAPMHQVTLSPVFTHLVRLLALATFNNPSELHPAEEQRVPGLYEPSLIHRIRQGLLLAGCPDQDTVSALNIGKELVSGLSAYLAIDEDRLVLPSAADLLGAEGDLDKLIDGLHGRTTDTDPEIDAFIDRIQG